MFPTTIFVVLCLALTLENVAPSALVPSSMTVDPFQVAFFPCQLPDRGQPLWVINGTEYNSVNLIPDHTTNISGLLVYVRPMYNNTIYQCRFVTVTIQDEVFLDKNIETSPSARLTVTKETLGTEPALYTCERSIPTRANYDFISQVLSVNVDNNLTDVTEISLYWCNSKKSETVSSQNCSTIDLGLGPLTFNESVIITLSPICTGSPPPLDYSILMAFDFNFVTKRYDLLSVVQQLEVSGTCLESSLFGSSEYRFSDIRVSISANDESDYVSFSNADFFNLQYEKEALFICFVSQEAIQSIVGNVKEAHIQEVGVVVPDDLCALPQSSGDASYALVFGSKGVLALNSTAKELQPDTLCILTETTDSLSSLASPVSSPSQSIPSIPLSITPTQSSGPSLPPFQPSATVPQPLPSVLPSPSPQPPYPNNDTRECVLLSPLVVVPNKVPGSIATVSYNFHGTCEHVFTAPCNMDLYEVIGDFLQSDLGLGRVGLRLSGYYAIIDEDLNIIEEGTKPDNVRLSETENQTSVSFFDEMDLIVSVVHTVDQIVIISTINSGELCGLCGSINGSLISSDGVRVKDVANKLEIDVFASSWLVEPSEQILHEYRTECVVVRSDTVIGDPLLQAPLWMEDADQITSLCYEVHGRSDSYFSLVSDECVIVNALYTLKDGLNVVSEIGVRAVTKDLGDCMSVSVTLVNNTCSTKVIPVNNSSMSLHVGEVFDEIGIQVHQQSAEQVLISVPNCEQLELTMVVTCEVNNDISMMRFNISRGVNLRPTSHGLLGQFWNIPVSATKLTEPSLLAQLPQPDYNHSNLYMITVQPADSPDRTFFGELFGNHWDSYQSPCLYAGNSQGGRSGELYGMSDPVIQGKFYDYIVPGVFAHNFPYNKFDDGKCAADGTLLNSNS